jgi:mono/diheme cytochrome c family protein
MKSQLRHASVSRRTAVLGVAVVASLGIGQLARAHASATQNGPRSVSEPAGVSEQVKRGEATYLDECGRCHAETLSGTEFGPALVGHEFVRGWTGKSVGDMFVRVRDTMPVDSPGRLTAQQYVDVIAFILRENKCDCGDQPLAADEAALKTIAILTHQFVDRQ